MNCGFYCKAFFHLCVSWISGKSLTLHFVGAQGKPQSIRPTFWDSTGEVFPLWERQNRDEDSQWEIKRRREKRAEMRPEPPRPLTALWARGSPPSHSPGVSGGQHRSARNTKIHKKLHNLRINRRIHEPPPNTHTFHKPLNLNFSLAFLKKNLYICCCSILSANFETL